MSKTFYVASKYFALGRRVLLKAAIMSLPCYYAFLVFDFSLEIGAVNNRLFYYQYDRNMLRGFACL